MIQIRLAVSLGCPRQVSQFFKILPNRACGGSPENDALAANYLLRWNATLGAEDGAGFDADMIGNSYLPAYDDAVFDYGAAGDAGLGGDDDILADLDVVADVHQVVDFCAAADAGFVESAAVNGGVGADFYVVF